jgi:hypothetical protein
MLIKKYTAKRKIVCYIKKINDRYIVATGKPSDVTCLTWVYDNITEATGTATEYYSNYTR